jgi:hypothetical protein
MQEMHIKYKILWFCVDTHHRQRYFFICGCKQTVKKPWREVPPGWGKKQPTTG